MKKHIIIAPHADDELIGCFNILESGTVAKVSFGHSIGVQEAKEKCQPIYGYEAEHFNWELRGVLKLAEEAMAKGGLLFMPDHTTELHPDHRLIGALGESVFKLGGYDNITFYTTNMNTPYMWELVDPGRKRDRLDECYPEKNSLWEYDHRYFLFEGYTRWLRNVD